MSSTQILSMADRPADHAYSSEELIDFMDRFMTDSGDLRKLKYIWGESGIQRKHSVLSDFKSPTDAELFVAGEAAPSTERRMQCFSKRGLPLAVDVAKDAMAKIRCAPSGIQHIITVSCTGMSAPGLEIELAGALGLDSNTKRYAVNFMGCYAAFHGLRLADLILHAHPEDKVLLVCVELCSIHFRIDGSVDNLLSTTLFADGAAAMVLGRDQPEPLAEVLGFHSELIPSGKQDMAWNVGSEGFEMVLSKHVPKHIEKNMNKAYRNTLASIGMDEESVDGYAIHPGGKNILKAFASALGTSDASLQFSHEVLRDFGNMSSGTVLFVLRRLLASGKSTRSIFAAAFGPGLSVESAIVQPMKSAGG